MARIIRTLLPLALISTLLTFTTHALALDKPHVQVSATGTVKAMPDFIRIHIFTEKTAKQKSSAKGEVDRITQQVINVAKQLGIKEPEIDASQIFMQPEYRWNKNRQEYLGEKVSRSVNIKLYDLNRYSELATKLAKLDITRMQQQGVGYDDIEAHQNKAMLLALEKAEEKAKLIAKKVHKKLSTVFKVTESSANPTPVFRGKAMVMSMEADAASAPLEIKEQDIRSNVNVIFLID